MAQWWDEWQLRILVLASLSAQYFLALFAGFRKFHIPPWLRLTFRLAHIGSDAVAIFALATLFNRQKAGPCCSYARGSRDLELLWAPILVMHLGGQVVIATYKIEDNEQWRRHILTSLSKVTVALYVFYKSWSSDDKRLLAATVLLFILVIIRCFQKALDLKGSSFNALRKVSSSEDVNIIKFVTDGDIPLDFFLRNTREIVDRDGAQRSTYLPSLPYRLILDFPSPYSERIVNVSKFWSLDDDSTHRAIEGALSAMTSFLYTKDDSTPYYLVLKSTPAALIFRWCTQVLAYATSVTAICLVHTSSHKEAYSGEDTRVTLLLLYGTLLLELVYLGVHSAFRDRFSGRVLQHNLIGLLAHNKWHSRLRRIAGWLQCKDFLDNCWHMEPTYSVKEITELVRLHVKTGWRTYIRNRDSYRRFNEARGDWTLAMYHCSERLSWSTRRPFDESIILWHLATDLCFYHETNSLEDHQCARRCKEMSNYMMHLLFENPEMLTPGSRKSLFAMAYDKLEDVLKSEKATRDERVVLQQVMEKGLSLPDSYVGDACVLAKILTRDVGSQTRMWEVIQGVWVEMLCFSAGRCRGYLHAQTLGTGVEYLSYVWVLLAYTGMETFPEKLQRRENQSFDNDESSADHGRENATTFAAPTDIHSFWSGGSGSSMVEIEELMSSIIADASS